MGRSVWTGIGILLALLAIVNVADARGGSSSRIEGRHYEGTISAVTQCSYYSGGVGYDWFYAEWKVPATESGRAVRISNLALDVHPGTTLALAHYRLLSTQGDAILDGYATPAGAHASKSGDFASGTYKLFVFSCAGIGATFTMDATATLAP